MTNLILRVGILGAGYISDYHLKAIARQDNTELVAVCDMNEQAAQKLADGYAGAVVYTDLAIMLKEAELDVVHVLTQPDSHFVLASKVIEAGCHAIIEKPVTVSSEQAEQLAALAEKHQVSVAVNHNFVFSRPFNRLQMMIERGELGPIKSIRVVWKKSLAQMNFGPWDLWMLREPGNILFETGSHSISELLAVVDKPVIKQVTARLPKTLPSGSVFFRRWSIAAQAGDVSIQIDTSFDQGYEQHFVEVEGLFGVARADIENDFFAIDQPTGRAYDLELFCVNMRNSLSRARQAFLSYGSYGVAKFYKAATGGPYETSMQNGIKNCYRQILNEASRKESSIEYAINIAKTAEAIQRKLKMAAVADISSTIPATVSEPQIEAEVLIVGASGFIGKRLFSELQDKGKKVRALVRNASSLAGFQLQDHCEIMVGDFRNAEVVEKALTGVEAVFHLAVAHSNSLEGYLKADSEPTLQFVERCCHHKIKRFIYTGTIDSLNLSEPVAIKESNGVDSQIKRRNNYAHSKAITESKLNALYREQDFPVVIVRPAIVLGAGGPVNHVGVANWFGLGRCAYWGQGENLLPLVLVDDVVTGLISALETEGIEGNTYNLSAEPCLSARDYVAQVEEVINSKITATPSYAVKNYIGDLFKWCIKVLAGHPDKQRIPSIRDWRCRGQYASFDTTRARNDLGWQPTNDKNIIIEKGIREPAKLFLDG